MDKRVIDDPRTVADRSSRVLSLADGRRIGYAQYGAAGGLPVIALHGTPGARTMFAPMDDAAWERGLRIIAPERPGYGLSDAHYFDTLEESAADIEALADALGLDQFVIAGYSGGGPYALAAALHLKSRIERVVLMSPVGLVAGTDPRHMSPLHHFIFGYLGRSQYAASVYFFGVRNVAFWVSGGVEALSMQYATDADRLVLRRPELQTFLESTMRDAFRVSIEGALQDMRLYCKPWNLALSDVNAPVVLWQGSADTVVPPAAAYRLADALPNCRLEVVEGVGHYWAFGAFDRILDGARDTWR